MRKLLIFGNGLGRSLDGNFFSLENALQAAWDDKSLLDESQKALIRQCLPDEVLEDDPAVAPKSEDQLDRLQMVLAACDEIRKHEFEGGTSWLTEIGKKFPSAIRSYIHGTACHFHTGPYVLPDNFAKPLQAHVLEHRSHIATLNYDELLYRSFIGTEVFSGYSCSIDGFNREFDPDNLRRTRPSSQAFYLHLHGSPLFVSTSDGRLVKKSMGAINGLKGHSSTHLVLTHVRHKESVINASPILREYWNRLGECLPECSGVVLFGYGGGDTHLNELIKNNFATKQIEVVERSKPEYTTQDGKDARFAYWKHLLGKPPVIWWHDNILAHTQWSYVAKPA